MKTSHIMYKLKALTDLYFIKRKVKTKNNFPKVVYSVLIVKIVWTFVKKFVWALMAHNL